MGKIFNYEGPVVQFLIKVFDMLLVNIIWIICCIPVITFGAATTAMYTVTFQIVRGENPSVIREFLGAFAANFKQATIIWLLFLVIGGIIGVDLYFLLYRVENLYFFEKVIVAILAVSAFIWLTMFLYVFPLLSQYDNPVKRTIINAYAIPMGNFMLSLGLLIMSAVILTVSVFYAPFIGFGLCAAVNSFFMNKLFDKYTPTEAKTPDALGECEEEDGNGG